MDSAARRKGNDEDVRSIAAGVASSELLEVLGSLTNPLRYRNFLGGGKRVDEGFQFSPSVIE